MRPARIGQGGIRLLVYRIPQDDPRRCTAVKLLRHGVAQALHRWRQVPPRALVLDPYATNTLTRGDGVGLEGIVVVDCSWRWASSILPKVRRGVHRALPLLLAANPVHYGHLRILSSAEALAAALYIMGDKEGAKRVLSLFKWGPTFLALNEGPLEDYSRAESEEEVHKIEREYFRSDRLRGEAEEGSSG